MVGIVGKAEEIPAPPMTPQAPPGGGGGAVGPGTPASPIDLYVYVLMIAAFIILLYYRKKLQHKAA
ncbi:hypothetical protein CO230_09505 [Chryseobacterium sp. 6424]|nr:hypothetical protein CO230_09505 [Chryseobacterium sp. 6424]